MDIVQHTWFPREQLHWDTGISSLEDSTVTDGIFEEVPRLGRTDFMFSTKILAKCGSESESKFCFFFTSALSVLATSIKVELNTRVHKLQRAGS